MRKKTPVFRSRKPQPDPYTSRIVKPPSKRELEASLRHAVRNHDLDALEDYDEEQLRPPTNAVKTTTDIPPDASPAAEDFDWRDELFADYDDLDDF